MGSSAGVELWVGVPLQGDEEQILDNLPEEFLDDNGYLLWIGEKYDALMEVLGVMPQIFESGDERVGFGVRMFHKDWDDSPFALDLNKLQGEYLELLPKVKAMLVRCGITEDPELFGSTDHT